MNKKQILEDLINLEYSEGVHHGKWEYETLMDSSSEEYLATMIMFAKKYDIKYDENISNYIKDEEYEAECFTYDTMGSEIKEKVENKLISLLLNG